MAMPRPSGKALKIAEQTIPGLNRNLDAAHRKKIRKNIPNDATELKVIDINENKGMNP